MADEFAFFAKLLDAVVLPVGDPDIAAGPDVDPRRFAHLPWAFTVGADYLDQFAGFAELLDPAVVGVGDPDVAVGVDGDAFGFEKLAFAGAFGTELA